ncbi:MAG: TolC family protein [Kofleriaceae bacterium]
MAAAAIAASFAWSSDPPAPATKAGARPRRRRAAVVRTAFVQRGHYRRARRRRRRRRHLLRRAPARGAGPHRRRGRRRRRARHPRSDRRRRAGRAGPGQARAASAEARRASIELASAEAELARLEGLADAGAISRSEVELQRAATAALEAAVNAASARGDETRARVRLLGKRVLECEVRAPFAGRIAARSPGSPAPPSARCSTAWPGPRGGNLTAPLFNHGRNQATLDVAVLRQQIEVARYEAAIQRGFREVADALVARATLDEQLAAQVERAALAQRRYELSEARYRGGIESYQTVLLAQQALYAAQQQVIELRLARLTNLADLYLALGGGWRADADAAEWRSSARRRRRLARRRRRRRVAGLRRAADAAPAHDRARTATSQCGGFARMPAGNTVYISVVPSALSHGEVKLVDGPTDLDVPGCRRPRRGWSGSRDRWRGCPPCSPPRSTARGRPRRGARPAAPPSRC